MGMSASQGRMLLLTARKNDLEYRAQQISQRRLILSQQLEQISSDYENATSNRQMKIGLYKFGANDTSRVTQTSNLTYAALMSYTNTLDSSVTGIEMRTAKAGEMQANSAYRLTTVDGAIVVSDESEISLVKTIKGEENVPTVETSNATGVATSNAFVKLYTPQKTDGNKNPVDIGKYATFTPGNDGTDSDLMKLLASKAEDGLVVDIDKDGKYARVKNEDNTYTYYALTANKDGDNVKDKAGRTIKSSDVPTGTKWDNQSITLFNDEKHVPKNEKTTYTKVDATTEEYRIENGGGGKKYLKDANGVTVAVYLVDATLKRGYTDPNGGASGPNYLQDCLRNGKYMLQELVDTEETKSGKKWTDISWDATSDISDSYYSEDDERAKAVYDRLQQEVQSQDKKLELELDNIETQRKAVTTEEESVKKVINDNIEGSFKAFA